MLIFVPLERMKALSSYWMVIPKESSSAALKMSGTMCMSGWTEALLDNWSFAAFHQSPNRTPAMFTLFIFAQSIVGKALLSIYSTILSKRYWRQSARVPCCQSVAIMFEPYAFISDMAGNI